MFLNPCAIIRLKIRHLGLDIKTDMSYHFQTMTRNELQTKLQERKRQWTELAKQADISRKTIERIAAGTTDPRASIVERLSDLLTA
jgi:DNA-binding XRE family transcriptional regulator